MVPGSSTSNGPIADTASGRIRGSLRNGVAVFRGIPFSQAPVGDLRFRPPQPALPWPGVRDCTQAGPIAPQNVWDLEKLLGAGDMPQDEDCLTLNVWTPSTEGRRPVMVWIHGGAFATGTGRTPWYEGSRLASMRDVVVVTFNYRLGILGFCYLAEMAGERFASSGMNGILDQIAALEWVRDNISALGGDPTEVTIFGESAGAMSVGTLLGTPAASGLFRRAILQSGACSNTSPPDKATRITMEVLETLGLSTGESAKLADLPVDALLAAQQTVADMRGAYLSFQPVVDGVHLPRSPLESLSLQSAAGVDIIVGTNEEEMKLFGIDDPSLRDVDEPQMIAQMTSLGGHLFDEERARGLISAYRHQFPDLDLGALWFQMLTDYVFRMPATKVAEEQSAFANVYYYLFSWASPAFGGMIGSSHSLEIPFVFDNLDRQGVDMFTGGPDAPGRQPLATTMSSAWTAFAHGRSPAGPGMPDWPPYDLDTRSTMIFDLQCRVEKDHEPEIRELWEGVDFRFT